MNERKRVTRKLVAQSLKPMVDEVAAQCEREGTEEEWKMMQEINSLFDKLIGEDRHANEAS